MKFAFWWHLRFGEINILVTLQVLGFWRFCGKCVLVIFAFWWHLHFGDICNWVTFSFCWHLCFGDIYILATFSFWQNVFCWHLRFGDICFWWNFSFGEICVSSVIHHQSFIYCPALLQGGIFLISNFDHRQTDRLQTTEFFVLHCYRGYPGMA